MRRRFNGEPRGGDLWKIIPFPYKGRRTHACTRANNKILYIRVVVVGGGDTGDTGAGRPNGTRALPAVSFAPSVGTHRVSPSSFRPRQRVLSAAVVPCTMWSSKAWTVVLGLVIAVTGKNPITLHAGLLAFVFFPRPLPIIARFLFGFPFVFVSPCPMAVDQSRFKWNIICWTGPLKTAAVNASARRVVHPLRNTDKT